MAGKPDKTVKGVALALAAGILVGGAPAPETVLTVPPDGMVAGTIEGQPARLVVLGSNTSLPVVHPRVRDQHKLGRSIFGARTRIGPVMLNGRTGTMSYTVAGQAEKRRSAFFDKPSIDHADAVLGPGAVPQPVVRFDLGTPANAAMVESRVPMAEFSYKLGMETMLGGQKVTILINLLRAESLGTAGLGQLLAETRGGAFSGGAGTVDMGFGVTRPTRTMKLASPLAIGPVALSDLQIRTADYGSSANIPDADAVIDPEETVVTAPGKKQRTEYWLTLGREAFAGCASITYDKTARMIRFVCPAR